MIPLSDHNPTHRRAVITVLLLALNIGIYFLVQPSAETDEGLKFTFEYAAIPCEVIEGRALTAEEVQATVGAGDDTACVDEARSPEVFPDKRVWVAVLISMFLHGSLLHLGGNMLFLWVFGNNIEDHLGHVRYLLFYLVGGVVATAAHVAVQPDSTVPLIGASGAVAAVMGAYMVWFPRAPVRTLIFFIFITFVEIRAVWLLGFWFLSQFFIGSGSGVAWMAHVGGFVFGVAIGLLVRVSRAALRAMWTRDQVDPWHSPQGFDDSGWRRS